MSSGSGKARGSRSKHGCLSCKKLRIKCNEGKPNCDYCVHTKRVCVYPSPFTITNAQFESSFNSIALDQKNSHRDTIVAKQYHEDLTYQFNLNKATSQLGISKFELRLLDFFNNRCIYDLSNEDKEIIHTVWQVQVPPLFIRSELIRNSIYSYAALNLFPLCEDLHKLRIQDDKESRLKFKERIGTISFISDDNSSVPSYDDLYIRTTDYFLKAIAAKNQLIEKINDNATMIGNEDQEVTIPTTEIIISSILIISFLGIHPHRVLPLVSFDESESDFMSICKGIRNTLTSINIKLEYNIFKNLFAFDKITNVPTVKESIFPVIIGLREDLQSEYDVSSNVSEEYTILFGALEDLQSCIFKGIMYGHPGPLFRWIVIIPDTVRELIHNKCPMALRLLYVFSSLTTLVKVQLFNDSNLWVDYMNWYKLHNFEVYGHWKYTMDKCLYSLVYNKNFDLLGGSNEANLVNFDPEYLAQVI